MSRKLLCTIVAIIGTEKDTLVFHLSRNLKSQWSVKCRSRVPGHGACLKSMSRTITMYGFMMLAIIGTEKDTLVFT